MTCLGLNGVIVPLCSFIFFFVTYFPWIAVSSASTFPIDVEHKYEIGNKRVIKGKT